MDSLPGLNMVKPVFRDWFPKWMAQPLPSQQVLHAHADNRIKRSLIKVYNSLCFLKTPF